MIQDFLDNLVYMTFEDRGGFWAIIGAIAAVILVYHLLLRFAPKVVAPIHNFLKKHPLIWICIPAAALIYFVLTYTMSKLLALLERRMRRSENA